MVVTPMWLVRIIKSNTTPYFIVFAETLDYIDLRW